MEAFRIQGGDRPDAVDLAGSEVHAGAGMRPIGDVGLCERGLDRAG